MGPAAERRMQRGKTLGGPRPSRRSDCWFSASFLGPGKGEEIVAPSWRPRMKHVAVPPQALALPYEED